MEYINNIINHFIMPYLYQFAQVYDNNNHNHNVVFFIITTSLVVFLLSFFSLFINKKAAEMYHIICNILFTTAWLFFISLTQQYLDLTKIKLDLDLQKHEYANYQQLYNMFNGITVHQVFFSLFVFMSIILLFQIKDFFFPEYNIINAIKYLKNKNKK